MGSEHSTAQMNAGKIVTEDAQTFERLIETRIDGQRIAWLIENLCDVWPLRHVELRSDPASSVIMEGDRVIVKLEMGRRLVYADNLLDCGAWDVNHKRDIDRQPVFDQADVVGSERGLPPN